jgi:CheY-like chemotaxis protein
MTLVLPKGIARHVQVASDADSAPRAKPARGGAALLVEDDDEVAAFTSEMLKDLGFEVTRAASGEDALKIVASEQPLDLVFSDVMMPGGMTGLDMAVEARAQRPNIPILLTSGYAAPFLQDAAKRGLLLLPKPFTVDALARAIEKVRAGAPA